jgi:hypothetical protein
LFNLSTIDDYYPVGKAHRLGLVMGNKYAGSLDGVMDFAKFGTHGNT